MMQSIINNALEVKGLRVKESKKNKNKMCVLCWVKSECELCALCIQTMDISYIIINRIISVRRHVIDIGLNIDYIVETNAGDSSILQYLIDQIHLFTVWFNFKSPTLLQFTQIQNDRVLTVIDYVAEDIKALRRLLLLILIENPYTFSISSVKVELKLLLRTFKFLGNILPPEFISTDDLISDLLNLDKGYLSPDDIGLTL
ncbi:hypothetical protein LDVICp135 [lymphocystis disease virus-China]|uniref:Uncharacterized protein n=2 Tax=Lymphocystis disease virus 2 TaxID=159183 RepID=A0A6F8X2N1_9VIRU|nr:hypothetical protein LDVICp135 [lymphocystis disease virus-China]AAU10980.1 hypothetical protein [lymphocystis disease virus-China]BCB67489.1 hypothetical protein [Lymphocystis disease virus 2]